VTIAAIRTRVDDVQRAHRCLAFPFAVLKKYGEDSSGNLAVLLTYYIFFSIFPLLLALFSVLGFVLHGHPDWQTKIQDDVLSQLPLVKGPVPITGSVGVIVLGVLLAIYSGLGVGKTAQTVGDIVYGVPKSERPGFVARNLRALRLVVVGGLGLLATTVVSSTLAARSFFGLQLGIGLSVLSAVVTLVLNTLVFTVIFRWTTAHAVTFRQSLPGAVICAVALGVLQTFVAAIIGYKLKHASVAYGALGTVIILLSWFYLQSQVWVFSAQVNVVLQRHLWPRSMTDDAVEPA
jgi:membrane protein